MGHLVNPISFRLGNSQTWRSQWYVSENSHYTSLIKDDFVIYKYLESFFKNSKIFKKNVETVVSLKRGLSPISIQNDQVNIPLDTTESFKYNNLSFLKKRFRYLRPFQRRRLRVRRFASSKLVKNLSLVYSHSNISRAGAVLKLSLNLYDAAFEKLISKKKYRILKLTENYYRNRRISFISNAEKNKNKNKIKKKESASFLLKLRKMIKIKNKIKKVNLKKRRRKSKIRIKTKKKIKKKSLLSKKLLILQKIKIFKKKYKFYSKLLKFRLKYYNFTYLTVSFRNDFNSYFLGNNFSNLNIYYKNKIRLFKFFWLLFSKRFLSFSQNIFVSRTLLFLSLSITNVINKLIRNIKKLISPSKFVKNESVSKYRHKSTLFKAKVKFNIRNRSKNRLLVCKYFSLLKKSRRQYKWWLKYLEINSNVRRYIDQEAFMQTVKNRYDFSIRYNEFIINYFSKLRFNAGGIQTSYIKFANNRAILTCYSRRLMLQRLKMLLKKSLKKTRFSFCFNIRKKKKKFFLLVKKKINKQKKNYNNFVIFNKVNPINKIKIPFYFAKKNRLICNRTVTVISRKKKK